MRVLVADDDPVSRTMVQVAVSQLGHECITAGDGKEAWHLFGRAGADLVVTDWMMPSMDGLELSRRIRDHDGEGYTYIILVTTLDQRDSVRAGIGAGADDYLVKPLDPFDLETRLIVAQRVTSLHAELSAYRARLARLAGTDPLTQLRNRLSLDEDLAEVHSRSRRFGRRYALAMFDVDFFKSFNDTYGHQAGDAVLRKVGDTLSTETRSEDGLYRYGGEEFLLILPEEELPSALAIAERARAAVERLRIPHLGSVPAGMVTVSAGVAGFDPAADATHDHVLAETDTALYRAKTAGRNRVATTGDRA